MAVLFTRPDVLAAAVTDVAAIGTKVGEAATAAAGSTSQVLSAAADEVSEAIATLFSGYGHQFQAATRQVAAFHAEFTQALSAAGDAYAGAEAVNLTALAAGSPVTLVMAGSGTPTPPQAFVDNIVSRYVTPFMPAGLVQALSLPAGEYPTTGVKDLTQDVSIARGVTILSNAIQRELSLGHSVNVVGYSQSANIASLVMQQLNPGGTPSNLPINFVLLGNSMNPNGGWDARFPGLSFPSIGFTTLGAAPANSFPTTVYTLEYDGWADFPRYPINIVSDLNALFGMVTVHGGYETLTDAQLASAIALPTEGATTTTYFMIPTENLPLLEPVRYLPIVGDPIADLIQPVLRPIVNWGYGDPSYGWSTGPANVPTPFGFLPPLDATLALGPAIVNGIPTGISAAANHFAAASFPSLPSLSPLPSLSSAALPTGGPGPVALPTITDVLSGLQAANTQLVGSATTAVSTAYSTLLPTADLTVAALVSLPSYDVNLFLDGIDQALNGQPVEGLINAIGNPIAANVGLLPFLGGLELAALVQAGASIVTGAPITSL